PNNFICDVMTGRPAPGFSAIYTWCPGDPGYDITTTIIERGLPFPYSRSVAIYRCPADKSSVETTDGVSLHVPTTRSYNLSESINGQPTAPARVLMPPNFQKETKINDPSPSHLFVFGDVHDRGPRTRSLAFCRWAIIEKSLRDSLCRSKPDLRPSFTPDHSFLSPAAKRSVPASALSRRLHTRPAGRKAGSLPVQRVSRGGRQSNSSRARPTPSSNRRSRPLRSPNGLRNPPPHRTRQAVCT